MRINAKDGQSETGPPSTAIITAVISGARMDIDIKLESDLSSQQMPEPAIAPGKPGARALWSSGYHQNSDALRTDALVNWLIGERELPIVRQ
jgi:hypothetical protein